MQPVNSLQTNGRNFMTNNAHQKIDGWFKEEIVLLKAKGANPADIPEEAFEELLADNACKRHLDDSARQSAMGTLTKTPARRVG